MSVEIFSRAQFEQALRFLPLGCKMTDASNGQFVYKTPVATKLRCTCGQSFYAVPGYKTAQCPKCGAIKPLNDTLVPGEVFIMIYSSVDPLTGASRDTGEDSIRFVLVDGKGKYLAKLGYYTTRLPGWEERMKNKCRELWSLALSLPRCSKGHKASLCRCRSGENKGRLFTSCWKCKQWLGWWEK